MNIRATRIYQGEWIAVDEDTYDGTGNQCGVGSTEQEAIEDLKEKLKMNMEAELDPKFRDWLDELNVVAAKRLYADAATLWQATGVEAWAEYYESGCSPADALTEDERHAL